MSTVFLYPYTKNSNKINVLNDITSIQELYNTNKSSTQTLLYLDQYPIVYINKQEDLSSEISELILKHSELLSDKSITSELQKLLANTITQSGIYLNTDSAVSLLLHLLANKYDKSIVIINNFDKNIENKDEWRVFLSAIRESPIVTILTVFE